jgi:murein L,D-transpeptidase YafK
LNQAVIRALLASAAIVAAVALAGCDTDGVVPSGRAQAPLAERTLALIDSKNMDKDSPILVRVFKKEAELEVWKKDRQGQFALLKTYPICRWSGDLGPKKKQGDRQAPEGFYTITPGQMNPNSNYYLAFNTGFPNAFDRSHGYTGSELMVHGDCSSRGCYAMTDTQIQEIYALARESFFGGQKQFQFEAFPFRMTALNMAMHRNSPNFAFWKMLKEGYDHFEATHQEPKVAVCEKRYVFDAAPRDGNGALNFNPSGKCPAYQIDPAIASTVLDYRRGEQTKMASYIADNVATATPHVGDGGTNPAFASTGFGGLFDNNGRTFQVASASGVPGALPRVPNPPGTTIPKVGHPPVARAKEPASAPAAPAPSQPVVVASVPVPEPAPLPKEGQAPQEKPTTIASLLSNIFKGSRGQPTTSATASAANETAPTATPVSLRGANTEIAAKRAAPEPVRAASAPVALHPKPQKAEPPQPVAVAQRAPEQPVAVAQQAAEPPQQAVTLAQRWPQRWPESTPPAIAAARRAPEPAPVAPAMRTAKLEKPRAKPVAKAAAPPHAREPLIRTAYSTPPVNSNGLLSGAQPVVAAGSFR